MSHIMIAAKCNRCSFKFPEIWVGRDLKGIPTTEGLVCTNCNNRNCLSRDWEAQGVQAIIPPLEDGNINRFEYSYINDNGKTINRKVDPAIVKQHYEKSNKGLRK